MRLPYSHKDWAIAILFALLLVIFTFTVLRLDVITAHAAGPDPNWDSLPAWTDQPAWACMPFIIAIPIVLAVLLSKWYVGRMDEPRNLPAPGYDKRPAQLPSGERARLGSGKV